MSSDPLGGFSLLAVLRGELFLGATLVVLALVTALHTIHGRGLVPKVLLSLAWIWFLWMGSMFAEANSPGSDSFLAGEWLATLLLIPVLWVCFIVMLVTIFVDRRRGLLVRNAAFLGTAVPLVATAFSIGWLIVAFGGGLITYLPIGLLILNVVVVLVVIWALYRKQRRRLWMLIGGSVTELILFLLPLLLWSQGRIAEYGVALFYAFALGIAVVVAKVIAVRWDRIREQRTLQAG